MDEAIKVYTEDVAFGFLFLVREVFKLEAAQALQESYYAGATARILACVTMRHSILEVEDNDSTVDHPIYVYEQWLVGLASISFYCQVINCPSWHSHFSIRP